MSDHNGENRIPRRHERPERDTSPSAYSQSSASAVLEWDPSADVGTRIRTHDVIPGYDATRRHQSRNSLLIRSRSEEEAPPESMTSSHSLRSLSMMELGTRPDPLWPSTPMPQVIRNIQNQHANDASSTGSGATIISHLKTSGTQQEPSDTQDTFEPSTSPGDLGPNLKDPYVSNRQTHRDGQPESDMNKEGLSDEIVKGRHESQRPAEVSESSTDWEYGPSRSLSHVNDVSSLSEWQSSGLTKSEMMYQSRRLQDDSGSTGTFSMHVDINDTEDQPQVNRQYRRSSIENIAYWDIERRPSQTIQVETGRQKSQVIVQTKVPKRTRVTRGTMAIASSANRGLPTLPSNSEESKENVPKHEDYTPYLNRELDYAGTSYLPVLTIRNPRPALTNTDSLNPRPNLTNIDALHRNRRPDEKRRDVTTENRKPDATSRGPAIVTRTSDVRSRDQTIRNRRADTTKSNLSSTCNLLLDLLHKPTPMSNDDITDTLIAHRATHIKKFRKELLQLIELTKVLVGSESLPEVKVVKPVKAEPVSNSSMYSSPPRPKDEGIWKHHRVSDQPRAHSSRNPPPSGKRKKFRKFRDPSQLTKEEKLKNKMDYLAKNSNPNGAWTLAEYTLDSVSTSSVELELSKEKERSSKSTQYSRQVIPSSASSGSGLAQDSFDFLIDKMNLLTDLCILNQRIPTQLENSSDQSGEVVRKMEKKEKLGPMYGSQSSPKSVTFFIPFPGCKCDPDVQNECASNGPSMEQVNSGTTLREVYERVRPETVNNMRRREHILADMKVERETRAQIKREWIRNHGPEDMYGLAQALPPKGERVMSSNEMRELTRKKYKRLDEVKQRILQRSKDEEKRTNRLMQQNFAHQLQKRILKGQQNIEHSRSLIRD